MSPHVKPPPPAQPDGQQVVDVGLPGNGMAVTSLVLGIVAVVMGLIPLTGFIAIFAVRSASYIRDRGLAQGQRRSESLGHCHRGHDPERHRTHLWSRRLCHRPGRRE
jgi:hypothetical protein